MKNPKKGLVSRYDTVVITAEVTVQTSDVAATCAKAAKDGNLPALKWLREMGIFGDEKTCSAAVAGGKLPVLKWAHENGCPWNELTYVVAAAGGHLNVLKWAHADGCPWDERVASEAAKYEHFDVLTFYTQECKSAKRKREVDEQQSS
tara:strand:+ start:308 stop:751 length:444 start_codon:yes stop_codon:yes gene_type:complete